MPKGRHRRKSDNHIKRMAIGASVAIGGVSVPLTFIGNANAATVSQWDRIAQCESGGLWNRPDGDGGRSSGGLQFQPASWNDALAYLRTRGVDTSGYPQGPGHQAYKATKQQQIMAGEALLALQGPGAWTCNATTGYPLGTSMFLGGARPYAPSDPVPAPVPSAGDSQEPESKLEAAKVLTLVNAERAKVGAKPLVLDGDLNAYAYKWSTTMAHEDRMYHSTLSFAGSPRGENVAVGQGDAVTVVKAWMDSPGHRKNILSVDYTKMGVGLHVDKGSPYWTQVFAGGVVSTPTPTPPPVEPPDAEDGVYVVKAGDYLAKIATTLKIDGGWQRLYEINRETIGPNPNLIKVGMKLRLPGHEAPPTDPYAAGLPKAWEQDISAKPLQQELKRVGYMDDSVVLADVYGPRTRAAVAWFHDEHPEYNSSSGGAPDVQIGVEGWAHLRAMSTDGAGQAPAAPAPTPAPPTTPAPPVTPTPSDPAPPKPPSSGGYALPVSGRIGDSLIIGSGGSMSRSAGGHSGLDISAPSGTPVVAATAGKVVGINPAGAAYGIHVVLEHSGGIYTLYAHLSGHTVSMGQQVGAGTRIGYVGSTGNSSGPHLHFEVRNHPTAFTSSTFLNPVTWLRSHGVSL